MVFTLRHNNARNAQELAWTAAPVITRKPEDPSPDVVIWQQIRDWKSWTTLSSRSCGDHLLVMYMYTNPLSDD
jgi:hypothetical protein